MAIHEEEQQEVHGKRKCTSIQLWLEELGPRDEVQVGLGRTCACATNALLFMA